MRRTMRSRLSTSFPGLMFTFNGWSLMNLGAPDALVRGALPQKFRR
jgi:hypothetical protein